MGANKTLKIKKFWDEQAKKYGTNSLATMPDTYLKQIEIQILNKYIKKGNTVLDAGCGNGATAKELLKLKDIDISGIDYSKEMIEQARINLQKTSTEFKVLDITKPMKFMPTYDVVFTERVLINIPTILEQKRAIANIAKLLPKGGLFLICEDTQQGLKKLNRLRKQAGLDEVETHWHNLYLDEKVIIRSAKQYFNLVKTENFSSTYYIASRIFNASKNPNYLAKINKIASKLEAIGDYGPLKLFVLRKK